VSAGEVQQIVEKVKELVVDNNNSWVAVKDLRGRVAVLRILSPLWLRRKI
jgi:hypothetical protein